MSETPSRRSTGGIFSPATPRRSIREIAAEPDTRPVAPAPKKEEPQEEHEEREFGGTIGVLALMIWSHYILYYFYFCLQTKNGQLVVPTSVEEAKEYWNAFLLIFGATCIPSKEVWIAYGAFFVSQVVLAAVLPGLTVTGLGVNSKGNRLKYLCNGYATYYVSIALVIAAHLAGVYDLASIADNFGQYLTAAVIIADVTSVMWYLVGLITYKYQPKLTGNIIYDFFMGSILHPRIGNVDIKMIAECRWSWLTLFLITLSCAVKQFNTTGVVSRELLFMILAHYLYSNATHKGEHYIPMTWDMFREKFGWMLNFWNVAGVPYLYCFQSMFLLKNNVTHSDAEYIFLVWFLLIAYYVFDTANCQKCSFRNPNIERNTFPKLPWGILKNPQVLETPHGPLLVDGWYRFVRKAQYTADAMMALSWGLICGFSAPTPYFYFVFFVSMILHRQTRDNAKCAQKYGKYWDEYCKLVPYSFIPNAF